MGRQRQAAVKLERKEEDSGGENLTEEDGVLRSGGA